MENVHVNFMYLSRDKDRKCHSLIQLLSSCNHNTQPREKMSKHTTHDASDYSEEELDVIAAEPSTSKKSRSPAAARSSSSKKRKSPIITPATPSKYSKYELFGTDSEDEDDNEVDSSKHDQTTKPRNQKPAKNSYHTSAESEPKKKKIYSHNPEPLPKDGRKTAASDVFGSDSDEASYNIPKTGKKQAAIHSYITKRVSHGVLRQSNPEKEGSHYIELKVYKCDDIKHIQPMNRWRHAIITIKNKSDVGTEAWDHLTSFIKATRQEFKDCRPENMISGYS